MNDVSYVRVSSVTTQSHSIAPNGSSESDEWWTAVTFRQEWADVPMNGIYAGKVYRVVSLYISPTPDHFGQFVSSSSEPWYEDSEQMDRERAHLLIHTSANTCPCASNYDD